MRVCFSVWLLFIAAGCSVNNSANVTNPPVNQNSPATISKAAGPKSLDCNDASGYSFDFVPDPDRASLNTGTPPRTLNIAVGGELHASIKVPTDSDAQNFSLREPEKTNEGFKLRFDHGNRYHYYKELDFICKEGKFYLYKMRVESFDGYDARSMDRPTVKETRIDPNLPLEKFSIFDYLVN